MNRAEARRELMDRMSEYNTLGLPPEQALLFCIAQGIDELLELLRVPPAISAIDAKERVRSQS